MCMCKPALEEVTGEGEEGSGCVLLLINSDNSFLPESSGNVVLYISLLCVQFCSPVHSWCEMQCLENDDNQQVKLEHIQPQSFVLGLGRFLAAYLQNIFRWTFDSVTLYYITRVRKKGTGERKGKELIFKKIINYQKKARKVQPLVKLKTEMDIFLITDKNTVQLYYVGNI